jgi:hypothetical protein
MDRVADPVPALAWTTSSPPNWILLTRALYSSPLTSFPMLVWESRGTMVTPECPPTTVTSISLGSLFLISPRNRDDRTTSRVVTPNSLPSAPVDNDRISDSLLGVKDTLLLVDLGPDGDGRVDGVGNDTNVGVGAVLGTSESQISDDRSVGVLHISFIRLSGPQRTYEKIVSAKVISANVHTVRQGNSRHTGLPGNTSGDDDELSTGQSLLDATHQPHP